MIGLPVQLSQSEASSVYSWWSMARTQLWCELFKRSIGGRGEGGMKTKITDPSQKRGSLFPSADERICLGCLHGPQLASTSGNFKAISLSSLSSGGGIGEKLCSLQNYVLKSCICEVPYALLPQCTQNGWTFYGWLVAAEALITICNLSPELCPHTALQHALPSPVNKGQTVAET